MSNPSTWTYFFYDHDVSGTLDGIDQQLAAAIQVVKLALGDRVVDIDCGHLQHPGLRHLVEPVHPGGGLLRQSMHIGESNSRDRGSILTKL